MNVFLNHFKFLNLFAFSVPSEESAIMLLLTPACFLWSFRRKFFYFRLTWNLHSVGYHHAFRSVTYLDSTAFIGTPAFIPMPTAIPTTCPSMKISMKPSTLPTLSPTERPSQLSLIPSRKPTACPSKKPSIQPTIAISYKPSRRPSPKPSLGPTRRPTVKPSAKITGSPTRRPSTITPTRRPSSRSTTSPTMKPTTRIVKLLWIGRTGPICILLLLLSGSVATSRARTYLILCKGERSQMYIVYCILLSLGSVP